VEAGALPIELDYNLESVARSDFGGTLEGGFTAHPKYDPATGETVAIAYEPGRPTLRYVVVDTAGRAETRVDIPAPHGPMVHDVGFTQNFIIVLDLPITFQPQRAPGAAFPYFWNEQQAPPIGLLPRNGDLDGLIWFEAPSCWVWHIVNAYEAEGGEVVVDVTPHARMFDHDWQKPSEGSTPAFASSPNAPVLVRWTLDRTRGRVTERVLNDHGGDFLRCDDRRGGQNYRYAYTSHWGDGLSFFSGPVYKHDVRAGRTEVHDFGPGYASLEPVYVPRSGATDEDDGYVMLYVFNAQRNSSDVVILSAQDFTGQPLAVVELPVRVPFGFHGTWFPRPAVNHSARRATPIDRKAIGPPASRLFFCPPPP
jgi:carotenoid cleavage dioxygenase